MAGFKEFAGNCTNIRNLKPTTALYEFDGGFEWKGSNSKGDFGFIYASVDFGKTIGWHIKEGRDFSKDFPTDSSAFVVNEAAVKFMNLKIPLARSLKLMANPITSSA